jgi:rhodanese-related sulfurtransferase
MARLTLALLALSGCVTTSDISRARAHDLVEHGALLVDVRDPGEYAERHPAEAVNIPLGQLQARAAELGARDRHIILYCHTGVRAAIATDRLRQAGYKRVHNLGTLGHWYYERVGPSPSFE